MTLLIAFTLCISVVFGHEDDVIPQLQRIISSGNCTSLLNFKQKLAANANNQFDDLREQLNSRIKELSCSDRRRRQANPPCHATSQGDGWCDAQCNRLEYNWDSGDCCADTCRLFAPYPCGSGGYQCFSSTSAPYNPSPPSSNTIPAWFSLGIRLCFKFESFGDASQCGLPGSKKQLCSSFNTMTNPYLDNTDNRRGGCLMRWGIESDTHVPEWFKKVSMCFRLHSDAIDSHQQCGYGKSLETCARFGSYTQEYYDNTKSGGGSCQMAWMLSLPPDAEQWMKKVALCFRWEAEGVQEQCGGSADRVTCAAAGTWTPYYRDDTDHRYGGCRMQWGIHQV